jgi:probable addiction module antidote protein
MATSKQQNNIGNNSMLKRTQSYNAWQMERLTHPAAAASFLNAARADSNEMFLMALKKVAQAHQMAWVAKQANVQRETLYRALSENGNPTHLTLSSILDALELDFQVVPKRKPRSARVSTQKEQNAASTEFVKVGVNTGTTRSSSGISNFSGEQAYADGVDEEEFDRISSSFDFSQQNASLELGVM